MRSRTVTLAALGAVLGLIAILAVRAASTAPDIEVSDAWIRWLSADLPSAGYLSVTNTGSTTRILVAATSPDFAGISLHHTQVRDGMSTMRTIDSVPLRSGVTVRFAESGYHLMLLHAVRSPHPGDRVVITLRFSRGPPLEVPFVVRTGSEA